MKKVLFIIGAIGVAGLGGYLYMNSKKVSSPKAVEPQPIRRPLADKIFPKKIINVPTPDILLNQIKTDILKPTITTVPSKLIYPTTGRLLNLK